MSSSSADVEALRHFVSCSEGASRRLQKDLRRLQTCWASFVSSCSWVRLGSCNFVYSLSQYVEQNELDAMWIGNIADLFELAGAGVLTGLPCADLSDGVLAIAQEAVERYRATRTVVAIVDLFVPKDFG